MLGDGEMPRFADPGREDFPEPPFHQIFQDQFLEKSSALIGDGDPIVLGLLNGHTTIMNMADGVC